MAKENNEKLREGESADAHVSVPFGVEMPSTAPEGRTRRGRSVATLEVGQGPFVDLSIDTFAVPSEQPLERNEDPARVMSGPEPTIFGGVNPATASGAVDDPNAPPVERTVAEQIGGALDEAVQTGDLLADVPRIDYVRIIRSTPFLLCAMLASLVAATVIIRLGVQTQTYVQTSVHFNNYTKLTEVEQADLQVKINGLLRTLPLRKLAWEILQKKAPDLKIGFLDSGLIFHRLDSITWFPEGTVQLRIESDDPASDVIRVRAVSESFYQQMEKRNKERETYQDSLKELQDQQAELTRKDAALKKQIDELTPKAEPYDQLKQSMQAMERFLEVADESNPLRLVARQNLTQLTVQVSDTRQLSLQRDDLTARRIGVQKSSAATDKEIKDKQRQIELFPWPDPPDAKTLFVHDTRPFQSTVLRIAWISVIIFFGGAILVIHLQDQRTAETARRERREKLKAQQQKQESDQP